MSARLPLTQGQFCWVNDVAIAFPESREREPHSRRGCVVIEGQKSLDAEGLRVVVVPTSSNTSRKDTFDVVIPSPPAPISECVALVAHVQPILRSDITDLVRKLSPEWSTEFLARCCFYSTSKPKSDPASRRCHIGAATEKTPTRSIHDHARMVGRETAWLTRPVVAVAAT